MVHQCLVDLHVNVANLNRQKKGSRAFKSAIILIGIPLMAIADLLLLHSH